MAAAESIWNYYRTKTVSQQNTVRLRNQVAVENLNLVREIAHRMAERCATAYEDLEQIGYLGLNKAIERFDPTKGIAFSSFAVPYIRGSILHHLRDHGSTVKIPRRWREFNAEANRVELAWSALHGRFPTEQELATELGTKVVKLREVRGAIANQKTSSLDEDFHTSIEEGLMPEQTCHAEVVATSRLAIAQQQLRQRLSEMPEAERELIEAAYFSRVPRKTLAKDLHLDGNQFRKRMQSALTRLAS